MTERVSDETLRAVAAGDAETSAPHARREVLRRHEAIARELLATRAVVEALRVEGVCVCGEAWGQGRHSTDCPLYWLDDSMAALAAYDETGGDRG